MEKQAIMPAEETKVPEIPQKETTNTIVGAIKDFVSSTISYIKEVFRF